MYENVTYADLKSLPKEQKSEAWKELKSLYKTQKELADKLGVSPNLVYNMISRYVKEESAENEKEAVLEVVKKPKRAAGRAKKRDRKIQDAVPESISAVPEARDESFTIVIKKAVSGEAAQCFLNGVGSTLLKGQKYAIEVKITEE